MLESPDFFSEHQSRFVIVRRADFWRFCYFVRLFFKFMVGKCPKIAACGHLNLSCDCVIGKRWDGLPPLSRTERESTLAQLTRKIVLTKCVFQATPKISR